jgi:hypothetical protein
MFPRMVTMTSSIVFLYRRVKRALGVRSLRMVVEVERRSVQIGLLWAMVLGLMLAMRLGLTLPIHGPSWNWLESALLYAFIALAPLTGLVAAMRAFPRDTLLALPDIALARVGRWRRVDAVTAHRHPSFGAGGLMAGFSIGLLLNIAMRTSEFLTAVPAMATIAPGWPHVLFLCFALDSILFSFLYAAAFVMAVRHVPWFPRFMLLLWLMDIVSQLVTARLLGTAGLPGTVSGALAALLVGNVHKSLLSVALWSPYLLLSDRVNVTYRRRVRIA